MTKLNLGSGADYQENYINLERFLDSKHHVGETQTPDVQADAHNLPFKDETFETVESIHVHEHLYNPMKCTEEIYRILEPAGMFYMEVPDPQSINGERDEHMYSWTEWSMKNMVKEVGFEVHEYSTIHDPEYIMNGPAHYVRCSK